METNRLPTPEVPFAGAPGVILARAAALGRPAVIGVTGPVGAGKSTLAGALSPLVIGTDSYLPDYDAVPEAQRDRAEHADLGRLASDLRALREGRAATIPVWSFETHRRIGFRGVEPSTFIVCEGIHAFDVRLAGVLDVRVFVDARRAVRWARWEAIERRGERGWGVDAARAYFDTIAEPTFAERAAAWRAMADVVVINDGA